jgi:hypothetical protein
MLPQDTMLHSIELWDNNIKLSGIKTIKDKPEIAIFNKNCFDNYCEVFIWDESFVVDAKDIYLIKEK